MPMSYVTELSRLLAPAKSHLVCKKWQADEEVVVGVHLCVSSACVRLFFKQHESLTQKQACH